jgi:ribosomal-protein-alanine N-acetyltransferase
MVKEDIAQVNEIDHEAFPTQWPPANYRQELQNKIAYYLVACDDTRIMETPPSPPPKKRENLLTRLIPWQSRKPEPENPPPKPCYIVGFSGIWMLADEAHLTNLAVRRSYQGKGIGGLLMIATIDLANELKASYMTLEVRTSNTVAQNLYSKYGFVKMGVRRGYYLDNREDAVIMSTDIIDSPAFQENTQRLREALKKKLV